MSSPSSDPYRSPHLWGLTILGSLLLVTGGFVLDDGLDEPGSSGYVVTASVLLVIGAFSLAVAAAVLGTRLALVEHEQSRAPAP
jgi:hypothetical protein